jgi:type VI secretion system secreted protein Hcp
MAYQARINVEGVKSGKYPGEGLQASASKNWIPVLSFTNDLQSPRDIATGQASGKRQWKPVKITKEWGATSPLALNSLVTNESIKTVNIEFIKTKDSGEEYTYQTIKLTNASFAAIRRFTDDPESDDESSSRHTGGDDTMELEEWSFTFQKIEVADNDGKTTFMDDWAATT